MDHLYIVSLHLQASLQQHGERNTAMAARLTPYEDSFGRVIAAGNVVPRLLDPRGLQYAVLVILDEVDELLGEHDALQDSLMVSCVIFQFRISGLGVVELPHPVEDQVGPIG